MGKYICGWVLVLLAIGAASGEPTTMPAPERTSPFDAIHIADDGTITVTVGDVKGTLASINGLGAEALAKGAVEVYDDGWKRRIASSSGMHVSVTRLRCWLS